MTLTYFFTPDGGVGLSPDGTIPPGAVICTEEQYQKPDQYIINYSTTPFSIEAISDASALQIAQSTQIAKLSGECADLIYTGFPSTAMGQAYLYPAKTTDQMNLLSSLMDAVLGYLLADAWTPNTAVVADQYVVANKQLYVVTADGTTSGTPPNWPTVPDAPVLDGSAQWVLWSTPFWCADTTTNPPAWAFRDHSSIQIFRVGKDAKKAVLSLMGENQYLAQKILAALSVAAVEAIEWP
ncbi:hypothetical protein AWB81_04198 [Caballeronia arationis]|uniref:hypothetical protein n=1 Tax=Caballeronia arationis TaxID=1777142 RepID=UPI00074BB176|nr:hypothetical protein [Caballeronia arationis]SAK83329.1 hypothetical protein AWB81_04198 [Caballeronia arationis]